MDLPSAVDLFRMFASCRTLNVPIELTNIRRVVTAKEMFQGCASLNSELKLTALGYDRDEIDLSHMFDGTPMYQDGGASLGFNRSGQNLFTSDNVVEPPGVLQEFLKKYNAWVARKTRSKMASIEGAFENPY
jgi:hypothetical protein